MNERTNDMRCTVCHSSSLQFLFYHHHNWQVQRCLECQLVQVIPLPSQKEVASLYHDDIDHYAPYVAQLAVHRAYFREKIERLKQYSSSEESSTSREAINKSSRPASTQRGELRSNNKCVLLDIGCAMGVLLEEARKVGWTAFGIDYSKDAVIYCRKKGLDVYHGTIVDAVRGSKLSFGRRLKGPVVFDIITAFEVIEHEREPLNMVRSMYALLKPGGIAVITTPNHSGWWRRIMGKWWPGYQHPEHLFFFDSQSITNLLTQAGFTSVEVTKDPSRPFPLSFFFTRAADYFPLFQLPLRAIGKLLDAVPTRFAGVLARRAGSQGLKLTNPINPWDGMMVIARKT